MRTPDNPYAPPGVANAWVGRRQWRWLLASYVVAFAVLSAMYFWAEQIYFDDGHVDFKMFRVAVPWLTLLALLPTAGVEYFQPKRAWGRLFLTLLITPIAGMGFHLLYPIVYRMLH